MAEQEFKDAKKTRRNSKAPLTRAGNWLMKKIDCERPGAEVSEALNKLHQAFNDLVVRHENSSKMIDDDEAECQETFIDLEMKAKLHIESINDKGKGPIHSKDLVKDKNKSTDGPICSGISSMQNPESGGFDGDSTNPVEVIQQIETSNSSVSHDGVKTEFMRGPGRCDTSHHTDFNETWPK